MFVYLIQTSDATVLASLASFSPSADDQFYLNQTERDKYIFSISPALGSISPWCPPWPWFSEDVCADSIWQSRAKITSQGRLPTSWCPWRFLRRNVWKQSSCLPSHIFNVKIYFKLSIWSAWPPGHLVSISQVEGGTLKEEPGAGTHLVVNHTGLTREGVHPQ